MSEQFTYFNGYGVTTGPLPRGGGYVEIPPECKHCNYYMAGNQRTWPGFWNGRYFVWNDVPNGTRHECNAPVFTTPFQ